MIDRVVTAATLAPHVVAAVTTLPWGGWLIALSEDLKPGSDERVNAVAACTMMIDQAEAGVDTPLEGTLIVRPMMVYA